MTTARPRPSLSAPCILLRRLKLTAPTRQVLISDGAIQGALLLRLALYGLGTLLYFAIIQLLDAALTHPAQSRWDIFFRFIDESIYWAPGLFVLLPLFAYDMLSMSNRFTGPVARLRGEMRRLIDGKLVHTVQFRRDDFWLDMADEFNTLREEVLRLREQVAAAGTDSRPEEKVPVRKGRLFGGSSEGASDDMTEAIGV